MAPPPASLIHQLQNQHRTSPCLTRIPRLFFIIAATISVALFCWQYSNTHTSTTTPTLITPSSFVQTERETTSTQPPSDVDDGPGADFSSSPHLDPSLLSSLPREELQQEFMHLTAEHTDTLAELETLQGKHRDANDLLDMLKRDMVISEATKKKNKEKILGLEKAVEDCRRREASVVSVPSGGSSSSSSSSSSSNDLDLTQRVRDLEASLAMLKGNTATDTGTDTSTTTTSSSSSTTTTTTGTTKALTPLDNNNPRLSSLPSWTAHHRFYVLGAVLTRDQIDEHLYVDAIIAGRKIFHDISHFRGVEGLDEAWSQGKHNNVADPTEIIEGGGKILCRIGGEEGEKVEAIVVPTHTTLDVNVNGHAHIVRCPLPDELAVARPRTHTETQTQQDDDDEIEVTFFVDFGPPPTHPEDSSRLSGWPRQATQEEDHTDVSFQFTISRSTRLTGFFSYTPSSSTLDPWQEKQDKLHVCVPGISSDFTCPLLDHLLEFLEFHLTNGVDHVHFGADYAWESEDMRVMLRVLKPYIEEGRVSVMSTQSVRGPEWMGSDQYKLWHYASCLAYAKGLATWVGIWDMDEFLVPGVGSVNDVNGGGKGAGGDVIEEDDDDSKSGGGGGSASARSARSAAAAAATAALLSSAIESINSGKSKAPTIMDVIDATLAAQGTTAEEACFLHLTSYAARWPGDEAMRNAVEVNGGTNLTFNGQFFAHYKENVHDDSWQKAIVSSRNVYFAGFHLPGACRAGERDWDTVVEMHEAAPVPKSAMSMRHFRTRFTGSTFTLTPEVVDDEYGLIYFPQVLEGLSKRGAEKVIWEECDFHPDMTLSYVEGPSEEEREEAREQKREVDLDRARRAKLGEEEEEEER